MQRHPTRRKHHGGAERAGSPVALAGSLGLAIGMAASELGGAEGMAATQSWKFRADFAHLERDATEATLVARTNTNIDVSFTNAALVNDVKFAGKLTLQTGFTGNAVLGPLAMAESRGLIVKTPKAALTMNFALRTSPSIVTGCSGKLEMQDDFTLVTECTGCKGVAVIRTNGQGFVAGNFYGAGFGLWRELGNIFVDDGWEKLPVLLDPALETVIDVDWRGMHIMVAQDGGPMYVSTNGGLSFRLAMEAKNFTDVSVPGVYPGEAMYATVRGEYIWRSFNQGETWERISHVASWTGIGASYHNYTGYGPIYFTAGQRSNSGATTGQESRIWIMPAPTHETGLLPLVVEAQVEGIPSPKSNWLAITELGYLRGWFLAYTRGHKHHTGFWIVEPGIYANYLDIPGTGDWRRIYAPPTSVVIKALDAWQGIQFPPYDLVLHRSITAFDDTLGGYGRIESLNRTSWSTPFVTGRDAIQDGKKLAMQETYKRGFLYASSGLYKYTQP